MLIFNLVSYIIFSIVIMVSIHYVYNFLKDNFTIKKIRYLGKFQNEKYQEILNELKNQDTKDEPVNNNDFVSSYDKEEMQESLLSYMQQSIS